MWDTQDSQVELYIYGKPLNHLNIHRFQDLKSWLQHAPDILTVELDYVFRDYYCNFKERTLQLEGPGDNPHLNSGRSAQPKVIQEV